MNWVEITDTATYNAMPKEIQELLSKMNGVRLLDGGLTFYNCTREKVWNALLFAIAGDRALYKTYDQLLPNDLPFAIDCFGDQYIWRQGIVFHLTGDSGEVRSLDFTLDQFIEGISTNPIDFLNLAPFIELTQNRQTTLNQDQLFGVYPPFMMQHEGERTFKAIEAEEVIDYLKYLYCQLKDIPDGVNIRLEPKKRP